MNTNVRELHYENRVEWFLNIIAQMEATDIDSGVFDIDGETESGQDAVTTIDFTDLAADALQIIVNLRNERDALAADNKATLAAARAEGVHFAANQILAAWKAGFIKATPAEAADVSGAVLSALEFLPNATADQLTRDYADKVRADIASHISAASINELPVQRDQYGFWTHPAFFEPAGGNEYGLPGEFDEWLNKNNLESYALALECDANASDVAEQYAFGALDCDVSSWQPSKPEGDGWFIGSIHDTEDGPYCIWLRTRRNVQ